VKIRFDVPPVGIAILAFIAAATAALGQPDLGSIRQSFVNAQNNLIQSAYDFRAVSQSSAHDDINQTLAELNNISTALSDPLAQQTLGSNLAKLQKLVAKAKQGATKAQLMVDKTSPFGKTVAVIKGVTTASKGSGSGYQLLDSVGSLQLGQPLLAEVNPTSPARFSTSAGFHKPGDLVVFQINNDGCGEVPGITVQNASTLNNSVDLSSVSYDQNTGQLSLLMGPDEGGARVSVSGCGHTNTMLLHNDGTPAAQNLPFGFPTNLVTGTYSITGSGTYCVIIVDQNGCSTSSGSVGPLSFGTIQLVSVSKFATALGQVGNAVVSSFAQPGSTFGSSFSPVSGDSFSWTISVTGSLGGCTCTSTATVTVQKL
jgi:hypothetical protein